MVQYGLCGTARSYSGPGRKRGDDEDGPTGALVSAGQWPERYLMTSTGQKRAHGEPPDLDFQTRAGDGNRTGIISLGICAIRAAVRPDLRCGVSAGDRERPLVTRVNGTLMARRSWSKLGRSRPVACPLGVGSAQSLGGFPRFEP